MRRAAGRYSKMKTTSQKTTKLDDIDDDGDGGAAGAADDDDEEEATIVKTSKNSFAPQVAVLSCAVGIGDTALI